MGFMPLDEKHGRYVLSMLSEDTVRGQLSASQESSSQNPPVPPLSPWISQPFDL